MQKTQIISIEEFNNFSENFQKGNKMPYAWGIGVAFYDSTKEDEDAIPIAHKWLSVNVVDENRGGGNYGAASAMMDALSIQMPENSIFYLKFTMNGACEEANEIKDKYFSPFNDDGKYHENMKALSDLWFNLFSTTTRGVVIFYPNKEIFDEPINSNADAHFRLAAMSRLKFKPNSICLDELFDHLPNLVWEDSGNVYTVDQWNQETWQTGCARTLVDKIPLLNWGAPIPPGVRIANPDSVRLGAYLSPGTTVMHYGFVNFNAGTIGKSMVEGRISAGTTIDDGTDVGAGAGFLGTLSGGNSTKLSTGKDCLIGANAECGAILGNNCVVATGICFTQNTPFCEITPDGSEMYKKAKDFNGVSNITFRRNAETGRLEVIHKGNKAILNEALHTNQ